MGQEHSAQDSANGPVLWERRGQLEFLIPASLALHGIVLLRLDGRPWEWAILGLVVLAGLWAYWQRRQGPAGRVVRAAVLSATATILAIFSGGAGSLYILWFFAIAALYPLLLPRRPATLLAVAVPLLYLVTGLVNAEGLLPPAVILAQGMLLALTGGGALAISQSQREQKHKQAQRLAAQATLPAALLPHVADLLLLVDTNGTILANQAGLEKANKAALTVAELVHPAEKAAFEKWFAAEMQRPESTTTRRWQLAQGEGWCTMAVRLVNRLANPSLESVVFCAWDVSAIVQQERLDQQTDKIESLSRLASGFAHDLNNLFTAIIGQISLAMSRLEQDSSTYGYLESARSATEKAIALSRTMQLFAGRTQFQIEALDVSQLLQKAQPELRELLPAHISLTVQPSADLPNAQANAEKLRDLLTRVVLNAVEAIGEAPGQITISSGSVELLEADQRYGRYLGTAFGPGRYISLTIEDNGEGMDRETLSHLFEPFHSTRSRKRGLGLPVVLGILRRHGAGVRVESEAGRGSRFTFLFPMAEEPVEEAASPVLSPHSTGQMQFILLIGQSTSRRDALEKCLATPGVKVLAVNEGQRALELFTAFADNIPVSVVDWDLPDTAPEEIMAKLRHLRPDIHLIVTNAPPDYPAGQDNVELLTAQGIEALADLVRPGLARAAARGR